MLHALNLHNSGYNSEFILPVFRNIRTAIKPGNSVLLIPLILPSSSMKEQVETVYVLLKSRMEQELISQFLYPKLITGSRIRPLYTTLQQMESSLQPGNRVLLADICSFPLMDIMRTAGHLADAPVIGLCRKPSYPLISIFLKSGGRGLISMNNSPEELITCTRRVLAGDMYFPADIRQIITNNRVTGSGKHLTNRENQVMIYVSKGMTSREIGNRLQISARTVEGYRLRLIRKLNVKNTAALSPVY